MFDNQDGQLAAGMLMSASLALTPPVQPTIPMSAVHYEGKSRFVYRIDKEGIAHQTLVKTRDAIGNRFVVTEGIQFGDKVVVKGLVKVKDGMKVIDVAEKSGVPS